LEDEALVIQKAIALYCLNSYLTSTNITHAGLLDSINKLATAHETLLEQQYVLLQQKNHVAAYTNTVLFLSRCLGEGGGSNFDFAQYVAQCSVIDSRVLSLQLTHCNASLHTQLESLFAEDRVEAIRQLLFSRPSAQAVKTKLDALVKRGNDLKWLGRPSSNSGIDEPLWESVVLFFMMLHRLRARNGNPPSEVFLSAEASCVFFPALLDHNRTKMNQSVFTHEQKDDLQCRFKNAVLVDEMDADNDTAAVDRKRCPDFAFFVDMCLRVIGEIKQHGKDGDADKRRLIFIQALHCILSASTAEQNRKVSFGLQFVGLRVQVTVLVPVNALLSVNLLLFDFDFKTCSMTQAIEYLVAMIAIRDIDAALDVSICNALFGDTLAAVQTARKQFNIEYSRYVGCPNAPPPPSPNHPPQPPPSNTNQRFAVRDVVAGTIVAERGAHTIVRSSDGAVAFKVVPVDVHARSRTDAVNELRVHMLLTRHAREHVVPLLAHLDASVTLPGQQWSRQSIVLVMPFAELVDVDELRDADEVATSVAELLGALAALHRLGVLHGDVKWSNTLWMSGAPMQERRRLVLCDFGLSVQLDVDGGATLRRGVGTADYMAPEVSNGSALSVTASADVYSAGVALSDLPAHAECEALQTLVRSMCAEQPRDRPSASEALGVWRDSVVPALKQQTQTTAVVEDVPSVPTALVIALEPQPPQQSTMQQCATPTAKKMPPVVVDREESQAPPPSKTPQPTSGQKKFGKDRTNTPVRAGPENVGTRC
jgi:serine/threonine protein kinase